MKKIKRFNPLYAIGFIVIPNMIALLLLSPKFFEILKDYRAKLAERK